MRSVLLYLDTCEHVIESVAEFVDRVLAACPNVSVVATSREPLRIRDERVLDVMPLTVEESTEFSSREPGSWATWPMLVTTPMSSPTSAGTWTGYPWPSSWCRARPDVAPAQLQEMRALRSGVDRRDLEVRHRTLEATIGWSFDLLDSRLQQRFCRLSVFRGGFTADAAAVVGTYGDGADEIDDDLDTLVRGRCSRLPPPPPDSVSVARHRRRVRRETACGHRKGRDDASPSSPLHDRLVPGDEEGTGRRVPRPVGKPRPGGGEHPRRLPDEYRPRRPSSRVDIVGALGPFGLGTSGIVPEAEDWIEKALAVPDVEARQRLDVLLLAAWYLDLGKERLVETATETLRLAENCGDAAAQVFALGACAVSATSSRSTPTCSER